MKIVDLVCSRGQSGFFFDDQKAIKLGAEPDGSNYVGTAVTEGFSKVRQPGESVSVMLILEDGQIAWGDCAAVQYSGAAGRDPLFLAKDYIPVIEREIKPLLVGKEIGTFKEMATLIDSHLCTDGNHLHTAIRYGVTQAVLDAVAKANKKQMAQVVADEYGTKIADEAIPIFTQSGDNRYDNADKMILKSAPVLPHALINHIDKIGKNGEVLAEYVQWLVNRIETLKMTPDYKPVIHLDIYGMAGVVFDNNIEKIVDYFASLTEIAKGYKLRFEGPVDTGNRETTMLALKGLRELIDARNLPIEIVADEWCNTFEDVVYFTDNKAGHMVQIKTPDLGGIQNSIEAVLYAKRNNMGAYLGGTCNETERSAQICMHIAMAISPDQVLAKPGMGVDEAYMIAYNTTQRILALKGIL